jgi:predicted DNA-binding transcriptional regulator YafY
MDRFDRIFELNRILSSARYPVSRRRLEEALECSRATVKRLIEEMRLYLNAPIVFDRKLNGYRYAPAQGEMYELPGLWFNASELYALLSMQQLLGQVQPGLLDAHLEPLRRRINELLNRQPGGVDELPKRIRILRAAARQPSPHFALLAGAVAARQRLQICYYSRMHDQSSEREISPQRLTHYRDNWYLDAWCHLREALRTFALEAIQTTKLLAKPAIEVPQQEMERHYASAYGIFAGASEQTAILRFTPERARWVAQEDWHPQQQCRWLPDGYYELSLPYSHPAELVMDLLKYGPEVEVIAPRSLRKLVTERLQQALHRYTQDGTD